MPHRRQARIAIVSKATAPGGGASRVAEDLAGLLRGSGFDVDHWVGFYSGAPKAGLRQLHGPRLVRPLVRLLHKAAGRAGLPELVPAELAILGPRLRGYDLVHFHDLPSAVSPWTVFAATRAVPCLVTLHDCSFFTGGCLYPLDCGRFTQGCGQCPQRGVWPLSPGHDHTALLARMKRWILQKGAADGRLHVVAPSRWMASMLEAAGVRLPTSVIPNGVDLRQYAPISREQARQDLDLPPGRPVVLLLAGSLSDRFKGMGHAARVLRSLPEPRPAVLAVGIHSEATRDLFPGVDVRFTGYLADRALLARRIAAADVLLYPSVGDNLPLVVLQSMACGVPVVSFDTGGIPEIIDHKVNGWLAPRRDTAALVRGLRAGLEQGRAVHWGRAAREKMVEWFSLERFLARHVELYERIVRERGAPQKKNLGPARA